MEDLSYIDPSSPTLRQSLADILRGMTKKEDYQQMGQAIQNTGKLIPSITESLARGAIAQVPGTFGDISQLAREYAPNTMQSTFGNRVAPTTEEILQAVPRINPDYQGSSQHEMVGSLTAPALAKMLKMGAEAGKGLKGGLSIENVNKSSNDIYNRLKESEQNFEGFMPHYKEHENLANVFEKHGLDVKETGSAHSNSRYVEITDPISGETFTTRFSDHPQSGQAMSLHGPADLEIGNIFKNKSWKDAVNPILDRINKARKEYGDEILNLKTVPNRKETIKKQLDELK